MPADVEPVRIEEAPGLSTMETFAVAVLADGTEVRMRNLGDRVEIRTWDKAGECKPPALDVRPVNRHVIDVRPAP